MTAYREGEPQDVAELVWGMIPEDVQKAWDDLAVASASAEGSLAHRVLALFVDTDFGSDGAIRDIMLDTLEERLWAIYSVPPERCEEVFRNVEDMLTGQADQTASDNQEIAGEHGEA
jgi:hypothetical protein